MKLRPVCSLMLASAPFLAHGKADNAETEKDSRFLRNLPSRQLGVSIGSGSCLESSGSDPCTLAGEFGNFTAGDDSCNGIEACYHGGRNGVFVAGKKSCDANGACSNAGLFGSFTVGLRSCRDQDACAYLGYTASSVVRIGARSCKKKNSCVLNGNNYLTDRSIIIGNDSCNCDGCCKNLMDGSIIGDNQCNHKDDNCNNQATPVIKTPMPTTSFAPTKRPSPPPTATQAPSGTPSLAPSLSPSSKPSLKPSLKPSQGPSSRPTAAPSSIPSDLPSQIPSNGPSSLPTRAPSSTPSAQPSPQPSNAPTSVPSSSPSQFVQHLTFDEDQNLLGLTDSEVTVSLAHLVNDDTNELQDLVFDEKTNELSLTNSTTVIDLSPLMNPPQHLEFDNETMILGMTDSDANVDLSILRQDLSLNGNSLDISGGGSSVDLSSFRVMTLQASVDDIDGDDSSTEYIRGRKLHGNDDPPKVEYGGNANMGWNMISSGRLVGMSIAANSALKKGILKVGLVDCTDLNQIFSIGEESLTLAQGLARSNATKFATPIPVEAGVIVCFQAHRIGDVDSEENDNAANLVLMLEQW